MTIVAAQIIPAQPATTRASPVHLSVDANGERIAYASGKSIFLRNLDDPSKSVQFSGHTQQTTVAKFSPSGYYVASGDVSGSVKIWSCDTEEPIVKNEVKVVNGCITDLAWDPESARIIAIGDGKEKWGSAFTMDSGNSVGEVSGHSSVPNAVAIKGQRPYRAATAGDDCNVIFYHGAPYKYNKSSRNHTKFVYDVKFSPDGSKLVSVGADAKIFLYDGKTGDDIGELSDPSGHTGSIFAVSWDPTSKYILTSSADQTVKMWSIEDKNLVKSWDLKQDSSPAGQQVGNVWTAKHLITLSLSGRLTYLTQDSDAPIRVVEGHQKAITALAVSENLEQMYTGSYDATAYSWSISNGPAATAISGAGHSNSITQIASALDHTISIGLDDTVQTIVNDQFTLSVSTEEQPKGVSILSQDLYVAATTKAIRTYKGRLKVAEIQVSYEPSACASRNDVIAVGATDTAVRIYNTSLKESMTLKSNRAIITAIAFSPSGAELAVGDSSGKIVLYSVASGEAITTRWAFHVNRITSVAFSPSGKKVISASLDTNVYVWFVESLAKKIAIKNAHQGGATGACWISEDEAISSGSDGSLKRWDRLAL